MKVDVYELSDLKITLKLLNFLAELKVKDVDLTSQIESDIDELCPECEKSVGRCGCYEYDSLYYNEDPDELQPPKEDQV